MRRWLESLHRPGIPDSTIDELWPLLRHPDRFIRFAARVALEHQPVERWIDRVDDETDPRARLTLLLAAARCAEAAT